LGKLRARLARFAGGGRLIATDLWKRGWPRRARGAPM